MHYNKKISNFFLTHGFVNIDWNSFVSGCMFSSRVQVGLRSCVFILGLRLKEHQVERSSSFGESHEHKNISPRI